MTAADQWLERTLDDSANRRISLPEGFLCASAVLSLCEYVAKGLKVNDLIVGKNVSEKLPFIATENLLMEAVKRGGDRQKLHEIIRECSMETVEYLREGGSNDLIEKLLNKKEFAFAKDFRLDLLNAKNYIGRCQEQVEKYLTKLSPIFVGIQENNEIIDI